MDENNVAQAIINQLFAGMGHKGPNGQEAVLLPEGFSRHEYPNVDPKHITEARRMDRLDSLIDYVNRHKEGFTVVYANESSVQAVIDHSGNLDLEPRPNAELHTATFGMNKSVEWQAWTARNKTMMDQADFAAFVDEHVSDIIAPDGAEMLEIALTMRSNTDVEFASKVTLANDRINLTYRENETTSAGRDHQLAIPEHIELAIPVYLGGDAYHIKARLLYTTKGGSLKIGYRLLRPDLVLNQALDEIVDKVREEARVPVYYGAR